ncbi:hypothetical protein [Nocardioides speluncae]|uniref:hypothetical protein n=1 Tax=Nocardioides speluncae TaxID=2670337 RepID=UPI000D6875A5|nr:hypothetical protein [Nocardioides speluncae]
MTWDAFHSRGEVLREVIATANARRDGNLPLDVAGVTEKFDDDLALLGAMQLRWHTRLAGHIERHLMSQPMDLEAAVIAAWHTTYDELPGVRIIVDSYTSNPTDERMATAMRTAQSKERMLLGVMSGKSGLDEDVAARVGETIETKAREGLQSVQVEERTTQVSILDRIRAALAA